MTDLISRQAAMSIPLMPKEHREYQTCNLDDAYDKGWMDCKECISLIPPEQQWIPASEKLPDESQWVTATVEVDGMRRTFVRWYSFALGFVVLESGERVVAWQPLPTPYQGGTE